ncbi:MAG: helix-turn-helix domain-containing protein [Shewanella sp.]|nr:helix-turn-helix domain-containing protein [Shewanella sp.]MCF1438489.1 helix-turn-helix domain-containing protein [Shewanella sp.]
MRIFRRLVRAGYQGLAVDTLQEQLGIPGSTLSHHIASLVSAVLLSQRREGRVLYCVPDSDRLNAVIDFLQEECCQDKDLTQPQ